MFNSGCVFGWFSELILENEDVGFRRGVNEDENLSFKAVFEGTGEVLRNIFDRISIGFVKRRG